MDILQALSSGRILLADGAMGTELQKRGLQTGDCPETYNITHPDLIKAIYADYYTAGSDIVETNSFGGSRFRLQAHQLGDKVQTYNRAAAELARSVCPKDKYVAGSIGPSGEILEPLGTLSADEAYQGFAEQALALAEGGADILFVETMQSIEEAETAVRAAKEKTGLPVAATMTFNQSPAGIFTSFGVDTRTMVQRLNDAGADILGSNCGDGIDIILAAIREMSALTDKPLLAQPNAGIPEVIDKVITYHETAESMQEKLKLLLDTGVSILGGCCGTGPDHIRVMRQMITRRSTT